MPLDQVADRVAVIRLVGEHDRARGEIIKQGIGGAAVRDLAASQQEAERPAFAVGERVEFAVAAAPADPDRLDERPPFPPLAERCASCGCCRSEPRRLARLLRAGAAGGARGTHDYQAGLKIASRMFYLECEIPTIIVTGFDSFPTGGEAAGRDVILGLEDVDRSVRKLLGDFLLGTVRYGGGDWEKEFKALVEKGMQG